MAIAHITEPSELKAGDLVVVAPFNIPLFQNNPTKLGKQDGLLGFTFNENDFFPIVTPDKKLVDNLTLISATRDEFKQEATENVGKEIFTAADLPAEYGVPVILRHSKHGDYRGFASNDNIDGWETVRLIDGVGHGSFAFWRSDGFHIHLAVNLDFPYNL